VPPSTEFGIPLNGDRTPSRGRGNHSPLSGLELRVITMSTHLPCPHRSVATALPSTPLTTLDAVSCDRLLGQQDLFHRLDGHIEVDGMALMTPIALVQLAATCSALRQAGRPPVLRVDAAAVRRYLWRCGFVQVVHPVATLEPPLVIAPGANQEPQASPLLLNVTRLTTSADLPALLDRILGVLRQRLHYRPDDACDGDHHKLGARRLPAPDAHPFAWRDTSDQMSRADRRLRPAYAPGATDARRAASTASVAASPSVG
jgi:hypothetical protein